MKKLNINLIKSIIKTDFFLLNKCENFLKDKNLHFIANKNLCILDIFELTKSLKQFIRLTQFIKIRKSQLNIWSKNDQFLKLIDKFFINTNLSIQLQLSENFSKKPLSINISQLLLILEDVKDKKNSSLEKNFFNNIFLISKISSKSNNKNNGLYNIYNDMSDYKKLIFMIIIIKNILTKTTTTLKKNAITKKV